MIDIGANLTNKRFTKDLPEVLGRAKQCGLSKIIVTGTNITESQSALALCQDYPDILSATAGVHPHDAGSVDDNYIEILTQLGQSPYIKAIGECGLDFNRNFSSPGQQVEIFTQQIKLASTLSMPLFLHQRDAFDTWLEMLTPYIDKVPAMVSHCFTGNQMQLETCIDLGMYIGITGWVCDERRGVELQQAVKKLPLSHLMIETDAPYLTPRNIKPKPKSSRNEPSYLSFIVKKLSELTGHPEDAIIFHSQENAQRVFGL